MAKVLQNQYYVMKIPSNKLFGLSKYSFKEASMDGNIVSIGDNLVLSKIREYYGISDDHITLYNKVQAIRKEMKRIRKEPSSKENSLEIRNLQGQLDSLLFVKDVINVKVMAKKEYAKLARNGFDLNGKHYVRFMVGSGQMRRNTVTFINEEIFSYLQESLMCGLDGKIKTINLAKLSAYFALSFSSVLWVREPRVCVIKDFFTTIKNQKITNLIESKDGVEVQEIFKDIKLNSADGQGLISPEMARLWAKDMHLNYIPSSFVVRTAFVKGNLVPFDFKLYAREHGITEITDRYGDKYNIEDIDVLLSESQFKMAKYYSSWEGYLSCHHSYNLKWGVARYNKEFDDEYVLTNYQYLQVLNLSEDEIEGLISYTKDWIQKICSGNKLYTMLYNVGVKNENDSIESMINSCGSTFTKAIVKNPIMLQDSYIQRKIYNSIKESIRQAKIGRIWVKGNYQFMISDPVAQCRNALGLSPEGLIPENSVYSNFWNIRTASEEVVCCRSPLTYSSEVVPLKLVHNDEMDKWYRYINSGMIYSIYDISVMRFADSDFDGDIAFSTDNKYFIKGARREELPIIYDKETVPLQKITLPNQIKCDLRGLDTKVGQITNYSTSMFSMLPLFEKEEYAEQYSEMIKRLKMCRMFQGQEIDKIKGTTPPSFPREWKYPEKIDENDTDEIKAEKYKYNSMVVKKKPYFFIYLYKTLMKDYKDYKNSFNNLSFKNYGMSLKNLMLKENKTDEEASFLRKYKKYSPVVETDCSMNILCKHIEDLEFNISYRNTSDSIIQKFYDKDFKCDDKILFKIYQLYREFKSTKGYKGVEALIENEGIKDEETTEIIKDIMYGIKDNIRERMDALVSSSSELFNYLVKMCEKYNIKNYDVLWDILKEDIIDVIPSANTYVVKESLDGEEYLGKRYIIEEKKSDSI